MEGFAPGCGAARRPGRAGGRGATGPRRGVDAVRWPPSRPLGLRWRRGSSPGWGHDSATRRVRRSSSHSIVGVRTLHSLRRVGRPVGAGRCAGGVSPGGGAGPSRGWCVGLRRGGGSRPGASRVRASSRSSRAKRAGSGWVICLSMAAWKRAITVWATSSSSGRGRPRVSSMPSARARSARCQTFASRGADAGGVLGLLEGGDERQPPELRALLRDARPALEQRGDAPLDARLAVDGLLELLDPGRLDPLDHLGEQALLGAEVVVEGGAGDPGPLADGADAGRREAALAEERDGGFEQTLPGAERLGRHAIPSSARRAWARGRSSVSPGWKSRRQ